MSQFYVGVSSGSLPPTVATSYVTDVNSPAIPAANVLNVIGNDTTINNANGIQTDGSSGSNTLTVQLTNRLQGTITTNDATPSPIITFTPTTVGVYTIESRITAFNTTDTLGAGYSLFGTARFDGATATLCGTADRIVNEETGMENCSSTFTVSGADILINAVGLAGKTINWSVVSLYTFVGT